MSETLVIAAPNPVELETLNKEKAIASKLNIDVSTFIHTNAINAILKFYKDTSSDHVEKSYRSTNWK